MSYTCHTHAITIFLILRLRTKLLYKTGKISTKHAVAFTTPLYDVFLCVLPSGLMVFLARAITITHNRCHYYMYVVWWYRYSKAQPVYIL